MIDHPDEQVAMAGVRGPLQLEDILFRAKKANRVGPLQVVRAECIMGEDHIRHAARLTRRAVDEGRNHADRFEVEFTRYLAGERQIKHALAKMGIRDGEEEAVVIGFGGHRRDAVALVVEELGLRRDDGLIAASHDKLRAFGIEEAAIEATTPERRLDLVLEAVASVDLMH